MAYISGNSSETRDKIKRVQEFLDQEIERVKELKNLLSTSEEKVTQLERELAEYKAAIAPTPINSFPPEILSMIFKLLVPGYGSIRHIGRLLLVCRRWHTLVMSDPQMWNNIRICVPEQWDMESWSKSTRLYIDSCIERSHATCLDIELDFRALRTTNRQILERLHYGFFQLSASNKAEDDQDRGLLRRWLEGLGYTALEYRLQMTVPCLPEHAVYIIDRLFDMSGEVGPRCESFTLQFPSSDELAVMIWDRIAPNVINLSRVHLFGIDWADIYWGYPTTDPPILSLPRVKDLRMNTLIDWEQFLSFDPSSIQRLAVDLAFEDEFFSQLARFSQLRTLTLSSSGIFEDMDVDASATNRISTPTLEELVLIGEFHHYLDTVKFDLPNLKQMRMESKGYSSPQRTIPTIQPLEVHWAAESKSDYRQETLWMADEKIRVLFLCYTSSNRFSVTSFLKENTLKVLNELSKEGVLPPRWKTVSFHDVSGVVETMHIDGIVSR